MRKHYQQQYRFDNSPIANVTLNLECRDEIVPILLGLQHLYNNAKLRRKVVQLVANDLNEKSRRDVGRPGMDDWHVVVLAAVRLGCNFDYDKLQDQIENHRALRGIMGIGDWEATDGFTFRRIRDTLCQIKPSTLVNRITAIEYWTELTEQVSDTARRRVLLGEHVPNCDKLFSLFETHTQLYRRGKAGQPNQYGRLVLVYEDAVGFISHYHLMGRDARDQDVAVEQTQVAQTRLRHSGVESAIGALQRGNGLKRCRDRSEIGFERYFGLAVLGRNIQTLGKLLLREHHGHTASSESRRQAA